MAYINDYAYYTNSGATPTNSNWGSYQYVSLADIVNNFMLMYQGNHELINNIERYQILFHAKRGIQELNYDAMKEIKILQLDITQQLRFVLPQDYVNWVRISQFKNGGLYPLSENIQTNWSSSYLQDNQSNVLFDQNGNVLRPQDSQLDLSTILRGNKSIYLNQNSQYNGAEGYNYEGDWYFDYPIGSRFGLNTETANANPTFSIDRKGGVINFSSEMSGQRCILEYVSDGMEGGNDANVTVNKMFEDYVYAYIEYAILNSKLNVQEYIVSRVRKRKAALLRNAKIRMSNIHPSRLLMNMRGQNKWLK